MLSEYLFQVRERAVWIEVETPPGREKSLKSSPMHFGDLPQAHVIMAVRGHYLGNAGHCSYRLEKKRILHPWQDHGAMNNLMRVKDDIRVYSDENMGNELFRIQQENIVDDWGTWAVVDSGSNVCVGKMRRRTSMLFSIPTTSR